MCGICGIISKNDTVDISPMVKSISHRGPDDFGIFQENGVSLGMTRLAILDLTESGHQPMTNGNKSIGIVYNGETYNFLSEKDILKKKGHTFKSTSDTEVILKMYEEYGEGFLERMRGMFALAIYDKRQGKEKLLLTRDQIGIKPLLYAQRGERLIFASEIKAILASGFVDKKFDIESLRLLLTWGSIYQPKTAIEGVKMLHPGHKLIYKNGEINIKKYWQIDSNRIPEIQKLSYLDQVEYIKEALEESVRLEMISDVPLGAFLSGGVDSSLLVAMMAKFSNHKVRTFSVGFKQEGQDIDETSDAKKIASHIGTNHTDVIVTGKDVFNKFHHIISALDQPSVDGVNSYFVSLAAKQAVTVAISGTGGDELFSGYPWFLRIYNYNYLNRKNPIFSAIKKFLGTVTANRILPSLLTSPAGRYLEYISGYSDFLSKYATLYNIFVLSGTYRVLSSELKSHINKNTKLSNDLLSSDELSYDKNIINRVSALCLRGYTQNQLLRDIYAVSMSHSLEVRVPFLDRVLSDIALSLPVDSQINNVGKIINRKNPTYKESGVKKILINIGHDILPEGMDLQSKRGFGMPFGAWLNGPLHDLMEDALSEQSMKNRGFFNFKYVNSIKKILLKINPPGFIHGS